MRRVLGFAFLLLLQFTSGSASAGIITYDANAAFVGHENGATETNPSFAPFAVGYSGTNGVFTVFSASDHTNNWSGANSAIQGFHVTNFNPAVVVNTSASTEDPNQYGIASVDPSQIVLHPGNSSTTSENAILRFIAPTAGVYAITGDFESLHFGETKNEVVHNGVALFSSTADNSNFSLTATLAANDHIDFIVNRSSDAYNGDSTGLRASLTLTQAVPEPSTAIAIGFVSIVGVVKSRRRRRQATTG
jgi:hypothetical protein